MKPWRAAVNAVVVGTLVLVAACDSEPDNLVKARIGEVWDLNIHTDLESINGLSAVVIRKAEVQFDDEVDPIPLEATSPNKRTWLTMISTGLFSDEDVTFTLKTVIPDDPDWIGRTGTVRWVVTVMYPKTTPDDTKRFEDKTWDTTVQYPIKFLDKAAES